MTTHWSWNEHDSAWVAHSAVIDASLVVAGPREFPDTRLCTAALSVVEKAGEVEEAIAAYLTRLPIQVDDGDGRVSVVVHPERPSDIGIVQIEFRDLAQPNLAHILFVTGHPDPYYLYDVTLDGMSIVGVQGGFW